MLIIDAARDAAEDVRKTHWAGRGYPVDPFQIARRMGIRTYRVYLDDDLSGMIVARAGQDPEILVHNADTEPRQNFTAAHELGHYVERSASDREFAFIDRRDGKMDAHEFYANEFAANLLMPGEEVRHLVQQDVSPIEMAGLFNVSVSAMRTRLQRLELS